MSPNEIQKCGSAPLAAMLPPQEVMFGRSAVMLPIRQVANKVLDIDAPILLEGEGGTGKELLARWIHGHSAWKSGPFVKVNCAAIPGTLLESELFGFEGGAFTGATHSKPGRVELAQGGTLCLDDIGEINRDLQAKLLQFLQDGHFSKIGSLDEQSVQTRVICATSKDLKKEIDAGRFRSDLFYRINVVRIQLPRLQERREDVRIIAEYLRTTYMKQFGLESAPLSEAMICDLESLSWPGNIRELSNTIARYVLMGRDSAMMGHSSGRSERSTRVPVPGALVSLKGIAKNAVANVEHKLIIEALRANHWNRKRAAQDLKISYRALIYKIREAGIRVRKDANPGQTTGKGF